MSNNIFVPRPQEELEEKLGYSFKNKALLREALTHSSFINEHKEEKEECNERLEFLGDSVLSLIVSEYIFSKYTTRQEGDLTKIRASVVCEKALAKYAKDIDLGSYLRMGNGEEKTQGRQRASITSDAFEALLASIYLDSDCSLKAVGKFLMPYIIGEIDFIKSEKTFIDHKTALQNLVQQAEGELLEYRIIGEDGPDHHKLFTAEARLNSNVIGVGKGSSKREAEQNAAEEALKLFGAKVEI